MCILGDAYVLAALHILCPTISEKIQDLEQVQRRMSESVEELPYKEIYVDQDLSSCKRDD